MQSGWYILLHAPAVFHILSVTPLFTCAPFSPSLSVSRHMSCSCQLITSVGPLTQWHTFIMSVSSPCSLLLNMFPLWFPFLHTAEVCSLHLSISTFSCIHCCCRQRPTGYEPPTRTRCCSGGCLVYSVVFVPFPAPWGAVCDNNVILVGLDNNALLHTIQAVDRQCIWFTSWDCRSLCLRLTPSTTFCFQS